MELTQEQKAAVSEWTSAGDSLSIIQEKIATEFGAKLTYMETRFLVEDLELDLQDADEPQEDAEKPVEPATEPEEASAEPVDLEDAGFDSEAGSGRVSVEVDKLARPGAVVSGSVTFSDGKSAGWMLDQMGQLRLIPTEEGYQPSQEDIQAFQTSLEAELRKQGF